MSGKRNLLKKPVRVAALGMQRKGKRERLETSV